MIPGESWIFHLRRDIEPYHPANSRLFIRTKFTTRSWKYISHRGEILEHTNACTLSCNLCVEWVQRNSGKPRNVQIYVYSARRNNTVVSRIFCEENLKLRRYITIGDWTFMQIYVLVKINRETRIELEMSYLSLIKKICLFIANFYCCRNCVLTKACLSMKINENKVFKNIIERFGYVFENI